MAHRKVPEKSTLQHHEANKQAPERKYVIHNREDKAGVTTIGDGWYNINLHSKLILLQTNS